MPKHSIRSTAEIRSGYDLFLISIVPPTLLAGNRLAGRSPVSLGFSLPSSLASLGFSSLDGLPSDDSSDSPAHRRSKAAASE